MIFLETIPTFPRVIWYYFDKRFSTDLKKFYISYNKAVFILLILPTSFQGFFAFLRIFIIKSAVFIKKSGFFAIFLSFLARGQLFFIKKQRRKAERNLPLIRFLLLEYCLHQKKSWKRIPLAKSTKKASKVYEIKLIEFPKKRWYHYTNSLCVVLLHQIDCIHKKRRICHFRFDLAVRQCGDLS